MKGTELGIDKSGSNVRFDEKETWSGLWLSVRTEVKAAPAGIGTTKWMLRYDLGASFLVEPLAGSELQHGLDRPVPKSHDE